MPEPFKNLFNDELVKQLATLLKKHHPAFDRAGFCKDVASSLKPLELKARSHWIRERLQEYLPQPFEKALALLLKVLHPETEASLADMKMDAQGVRGWAIMPMADFVACNGLPYFDMSMDALKEMTKRFSAEFAVRQFIIHDQKRALTHIRAWAEDGNVHVRRLASEGSRPRLPWGQQIPAFIQNPKPMLPVLKTLRDDSSEYVRKSVANHLNDISKDNPDVFIRVAEQWLRKAPPERQKLIRHASRTLIKSGDAQMLEILGFSGQEIQVNSFRISSNHIAVGDDLILYIEFENIGRKPHNFMLDYKVYFKKSNGGHSAKVFKWTSAALAPGEKLRLQKKHAFKPVTTRRYYCGQHSVSVQINGSESEPLSFVLDVLES